jgi:transposase
MQIDQIQVSQNEVSITVIATHPTSCCPLCSYPSSSIHSRYCRTVRDAPCGDRYVQLTLCVRKFFCRNPQMSSAKSRRERLADLVRPWAKMTIRYGEQITSIGLATCGKGGTRLAARLGMHTSRQTLLRRIMALPDPPVSSILYLGIDDFAFRRGCRFGTILVNLESHRVVDLLPDRKAETAAKCQRQQLDLMAVSRDRGGEYASAATQGAPQALQCADRFHLLKNLGEALKGLLAHHLAAERKRQIHVTVDSQAPVWQAKRVTRSSPTLLRLQQARREERLAYYEQVIARL